jgi:magnesium chelatase family protein
MNILDNTTSNSWTEEEKDRVVKVFKWLIQEDKKQNPNLHKNTNTQVEPKYDNNSPMEDKKITITRTKESVTYPADCIYILAMNPCACGGKNCTCTDKEILRYRKKISGPIADRIDIWISVSKIEYENFSEAGSENKNSSAAIAERVKRARLFKKSRMKNIKMDPETLSFFTQSAKKLGFSGRAYARTADVAGTIADLAQSEEIKKEHVMEALQYRNRE